MLTCRCPAAAAGVWLPQLRLFRSTCPVLSPLPPLRIYPFDKVESVENLHQNGGKPGNPTPTTPTRKRQNLKTIMWPWKAGRRGQQPNRGTILHQSVKWCPPPLGDLQRIRGRTRQSVVIFRNRDFLLEARVQSVFLLHQSYFCQIFISHLRSKTDYHASRPERFWDENPRRFKKPSNPIQNCERYRFTIE